MVTAKNKSETELAFENLSKLEVPASVRDFAEKGAAQAKETYTKIKAATDEASNALENTYSTATKGVSTLGLKVLENARTNTNATFDHAIALFGVKTFSDVIELNTAFVRKQAESLSAQAKEFGELAQKVANETAAPVKAQVEKSFKSVA
ncbi:phasin [Labrys okinawensis]|uniref:phasin n=1 Tax=Labrys okinawensis TaxID=346911 RepID=UPI0039BC2E40